jgi:uncharacterized protein
MWVECLYRRVWKSYQNGMQKQEEPEPEIAVVGSKGQIVIPQELRRRLKIAPKTRLAIYRRNDKLIITRLRIAPLREELSSLFKKIDKEYPRAKKKPTEREILEEIQAYRREKKNLWASATNLVRVVVDTNVLVSAILNRGKARTLVLELMGTHTIISSIQMLAEFAEVMTRNKFHSIQKSRIETFKLLMIRRSTLVEPATIEGVIKEDPDDDAVLGVAHAGHAEYIVTGDPHLLALSEFKGAKIVRVSQLLQIITSESRWTSPKKGHRLHPIAKLQANLYS